MVTCNIQTLAIEMYKLANGISPPNVMNEIFQSMKINHYQLRHISQFIVYSVHGVYNRTELQTKNEEMETY